MEGHEDEGSHEDFLGEGNKNSDMAREPGDDDNEDGKKKEQQKF